MARAYTKSGGIRETFSCLKWEPRADWRLQNSAKGEGSGAPFLFSDWLAGQTDLRTSNLQRVVDVLGLPTSPQTRRQVKRSSRLSVQNRESPVGSTSRIKDGNHQPPRAFRPATEIDGQRIRSPGRPGEFSCSKTADHRRAGVDPAPVAKWPRVSPTRPPPLASLPSTPDPRIKSTPLRPW